MYRLPRVICLPAWRCKPQKLTIVPRSRGAAMYGGRKSTNSVPPPSKESPSFSKITKDTTESSRCGANEVWNTPLDSPLGIHLCSYFTTNKSSISRTCKGNLNIAERAGMILSCNFLLQRSNSKETNLAEKLKNDYK